MARLTHLEIGEKSAGAQAIDDLFGHVTEDDTPPVAEVDEPRLPCCGRVVGSAHSLDCRAYGTAPDVLRCESCGTAQGPWSDQIAGYCVPCAEDLTGERACCGTAFGYPHHRRCPDREF